MPPWENVRPTLVACYDAIEASAHGIARHGAIATALGIDTSDPDAHARLMRTLHALAEDEYIAANFAWQDLGASIEATPRGRQEVQGWPGPRTADASAELLVALLRQQADAEETSPAERSKLRTIVAAIGDGGLTALSKVTAEVVTRAGGAVIP